MKNSVLAKVLSALMAWCLIVTFALPASWSTLAFAEGADGAASPQAASATDTTPGRKLDDKGKPLFEAEHINLTGGYTVASDGQIIGTLEWSSPVENPMKPGTGQPDPGRPYKYLMWQSRQNDNGSWTPWETRSPVNIDAGDGQVKVLNVYPSAAVKDSAKNWMNTMTSEVDEKGNKLSIGRNIINVTPVYIEDYNANPDTYLKDANGDYKYSVIFFGTFDSNNGKDLSQKAVTATMEFSRRGGGLLFGHDTLRKDYSNFCQFASKEFLNMDIGPIGSKHMSKYVKVVDSGFLTSRPWDLEGKTLTIPEAHAYGQNPGGANADGTPRNRVWMQFSDASGVVSGTKMSHGSTAVTDNMYLVTNGSTAMIQTGHSSGQATTDEQKVIANTLIYLAQTSVTTSARDSSFVDEAKPAKPSEATVSGISLAQAASTDKYSAKVSMTGATDQGTNYAYRIQAIPQSTVTDGSFYGEVWSTAKTDREDPEVFQMRATSGLKGYYVNVNSNGASEDFPKAQRTADKFVAAQSASDAPVFEAKNLTVGLQYYAHVYAVDFAGNISEDTIVPIKVTTNKLNFHYNDGAVNADGTAKDDIINVTLLTDNAKAASWTAAPTRAGYRFDGWFDNPACTGASLNATEATFPDDKKDAKGEANVYAKWVKVWNITVAERGIGNVTVGTETNPGPFDEGTDVPISWTPTPGYHIKSVWVNGTLIDDPTTMGASILGIDGDAFVVVEFEEDDEAGADTGMYSVKTSLRGGATTSTITPSKTFAKTAADASNYEVVWDAGTGNHVTLVKVDGIERPDLLQAGKVVFGKVSCDHTVEVTVAPDTIADNKVRVDVQLTGGPGSASSSAEITKGTDYAFSAAVDSDEDVRKNYEVESVKVYKADGTDVTANYAFAQDTYTSTATLASIGEDLKVVVRLRPKSQAGTVALAADELMKIETSHTGSGTISASRIVKRGSSYNVEWEADEGWELFSVTVDGKTILYPEAKADAAPAPTPALPAEPGTEEGEEPEPASELSGTFASPSSTGVVSSLPSLVFRALAAIQAADGAGLGASSFETIFDTITPLAAAFDGSGAALIKSPGNYPFAAITASHSVHATFVKSDPVPPTVSPTFDEGGDDGDGDDPDVPRDPAADDPFFQPDPEATEFSVLTEVIGDAPVTMTASRIGLPRGSDYPIEWTVPAGYRVTGIKINGVDRPDLFAAGKVELKDLDRNYLVSLRVEPDRAATTTIEKRVSNLSSSDGNTVGDELEYTITLTNTERFADLVDAKIVDVIPAALDVNIASIKLQVAGGVIEAVSFDAYDEATRTLTVPIEKLEGGKSAVVTFKARVNALAIQPDTADIKNIAVSETSEGEKSPSDPASPNDGKTVRPVSTADIEVVKAAKNNSSTTEDVRVGDVLTYTITLANKEAGSVYSGARITDSMPLGIELDTSTLALIAPDGTVKNLSADTYDATTRTIAVFVGDVFGGETYALTFSATVTEAAVGTDIANIARIFGTDTPDAAGVPGHWGSPVDYGVEPGDPGFEPVTSAGADGEKPTETPKTYPTPSGEPSSKPVTVNPAVGADDGKQLSNTGLFYDGNAYGGTVVDQLLPATGDHLTTTAAILGCLALAGLALAVVARRKCAKE